jgi:hypothetical protein
MSTRSRIGIELENGKVQSVYCHFDGYVDGVGKVLINHYTDIEKIRKMIFLGDMSSLAESVECPEGHSYENRKEGFSVFYGRDRGETGIHSVTHSEDIWPDYGQDYEYLFKGGQWLIRYDEPQFRPVTEVLKEESKE